MTSAKPSRESLYGPDRIAPRASRPDLVIQISGPPLAGKSTFIREHARKHDVILDDYSVTGLYGWDNVPDKVWQAWHAHVREAVATHRGPGALWFTRSDPAPLAEGIRVIVLVPSPAELARRLQAGDRPPQTADWIERWFRKYGAVAQQRQG